MLIWGFAFGVRFGSRVGRVLGLGAVLGCQERAGWAELSARKELENNIMDKISKRLTNSVRLKFKA